MLGDENNNDLIDLSSIDRAKCALLVIDELGHERATDRTAQWVFNLVHRRWKRRRTLRSF